MWLVNNSRLFFIKYSTQYLWRVRAETCGSDAVFTFITNWRRGNFLAASKETRRDCTTKKPTTRWRSGAQQSQPSLKVSDDSSSVFFFFSREYFENVGEFWSARNESNRGLLQLFVGYHFFFKMRVIDYSCWPWGSVGLVSTYHVFLLFATWRSILCLVELNSSFQGMKRQTNWGHFSKSHGHRRLLVFFVRVIRIFTLANFVFSSSFWFLLFTLKFQVHL